MNLFGKIGNYLVIAMELTTLVSSIQAIVSEKTVDAKKLAGAVTPVLQELANVLPHVNIPTALIADCAAAVADVLNQWFKKPSPAAAPAAFADTVTASGQAPSIFGRPGA